MQDKVSLVTGGSSGIGLATALAFAREGATVVLASRNQRRAEAATKAFGEYSGGVSWIACDVSSGGEVEKLCATIKRRHGRLDYAFNNGGSGGRSTPVASTTEEAWRKTIDGFLTSVFLGMRFEIPLMLATGGGVIVNNSSVDGLRGYPFPGGAAYAAAKHGVLGLTKSAALEHAAKGPRPRRYALDGSTRRRSRIGCGATQQPLQRLCGKPLAGGSRRQRRSPTRYYGFVRMRLRSSSAARW